jgi:hypothetical protein
VLPDVRGRLPPPREASADGRVGAINLLSASFGCAFRMTLSIATFDRGALTFDPSGFHFIN